MEELKLVSIKTKNLNKKLIEQIIVLKNTHWKYSLKSQLEFFNKNIKNEDLHNLLIINKKIIGYTLLRSEKIKLKKLKKNYFLFDTLILNKSYRKSGLAVILMNFNNYIIKKYKRSAILVCDKKVRSFYTKFGWKQTTKKNKLFINFNLNKPKQYFSYNE